MSNNKNTGINLEDFLGFFLLDSQEQIEKLGSGLLELEKDSDNIMLVNDLFRSAHSLKGASGTMGFTPIVELTHAAEDMLDKLRQRKITATNEIIDVLLAVTDKVKLMLAQVEQRTAITEEYSDLVIQMKAITEIGASLQLEKMDENDSISADLLLTPTELEVVNDEIFSGKAFWQITVVLEPNAQMKAVRSFMVLQRLEPLGSIIKVLPSPEEIEANSVEEFNVLFITNEPAEEIRVELMEISEIQNVLMTPCSLNSSSAPQESSEEVQEKPKEVGEVSAQDPKNNQVHTIRVDTVRMDNLINLVGEMVITRTRLVKIANDLKESNKADLLVDNLNDTNVYLGRLMSELQESVMRLRMVPVGTVFSRYPRMVRDFCRKTGKKIELVIKGEETELDKTVIESIGDPLTHIIRNSVDHGIETPEQRLMAGKKETGTITLDACHEGNHIAITVSDDGAGLNLEKIYKKALTRGLISEGEDLSDRDIANFIFLPGFSTADQITDMSGRGVGMDVVKKTLNYLGGLIEIKTESGQGTSFIIRLPLTLAIIQALLVEVSGEIYAVPLASVNETLLVKVKDIRTVGGLPMVHLRGNTLPLVSLRNKFNLPENDNVGEEIFVVVVGIGDKTIGLIVDELHGQQEIVIKSLGDCLNGLPGISGATILGDGKVTLILDVASLIQDSMSRVYKKN